MGKAAKGTLLKIGDGAATEVFTNIYEVRDISSVGTTLNTAETTHHSAAMEEVVATYHVGSEIGFQVNINPRNATHSTDGLEGAHKDKTDKNFQLVVPAATSTAGDQLAFNGFVTGISAGYAVGGEEVADVTVKIHKTLPVWSTLAAVA